jgi:hypothetical protein
MATTIAAMKRWKIDIVQRRDLDRFVVLSKLRIDERGFARTSSALRLTPDLERYAGTAAAFVRLAGIRIKLKRLTKPNLCSRIPSSRIGSKKEIRSDIRNAPYSR